MIGETSKVSVVKKAVNRLFVKDDIPRKSSVMARKKKEK
jgi:hypothetical protein